MAERDPLDRLSEVADMAQQPDPDFAARLLADLLADLGADHTNETEPTIVELEEDIDMKNRKLLWPLAAAAMTIALLGAVFLLARDDDDSIATDPPTATATSEQDDDDQSATETTATTESAPTSEAAGDDGNETELLAVGAAFLDAYYSGDPAAIEALTAEDAPLQNTLYSQAYDEASNVEVVERSCTVTAERTGVTCTTLTTDDVSTILGTAEMGTEFVLRVVDDEILGVSINLDNPRQIDDLFTWITTTRPDIMEGPCAGVRSSLGPADECAIATTAAAAEFVETDDYVAP